MKRNMPFAIKILLGATVEVQINDSYLLHAVQLFKVTCESEYFVGLASLNILEKCDYGTTHYGSHQMVFEIFYSISKVSK